MPIPCALDYTAIRRAIMAALASATGLAPSQIISAEPEASDAPRPEQPYITVKITAASARYGRDWALSASPDADGWSVTGPRSLDVSFNAFAETHEDAQNLMAVWAASMQSPECQSTLAASNIALWQIEDIRDLSEQDDTSWQPRVYLQATFGATSSLDYAFNSIGQVIAPDGTLIAASSQASGDISAPSAGVIASSTVQPTDSPGMLVCITGDATMSYADANTAQRIPCVAMLIAKDGDTAATLQMSGVTPSGLLSGLVPAASYFVGLHGATTAAPVTGYQYIQRIGVAISSTQLLLQIGLAGIVLRDLS